MSRILCRKLAIEDVQAVSALIIRNLLEVNTADYPLEEMQAQAKAFTPQKIESYTQWRDIYVAEDDGKIIGTASVVKEPTDGACAILTVFVLPEYHGKGIGRLLMGCVELQAEMNGANKVWLPAGITGHRFYEKLGYTYKDGVKQLDEEGHYIMVKAVGSPR